MNDHLFIKEKRGYHLSKSLKGLFLFTDIGFILYWVFTALALIPKEYLYQDYTNELLVAWNWSFFPLDILISITGMYSIYLHKQMNIKWRSCLNLAHPDILFRTAGDRFLDHEVRF